MAGVSLQLTGCASDGASAAPRLHQCNRGGPARAAALGTVVGDVIATLPRWHAYGRHVDGRQKLLARRESWQANYLTAVRFDRDRRGTTDHTRAR